jgi:hypothetical protein
MGLMSIPRLTLATVVSLCSLTGVLLFSAPVAFAVTPPAIEEEAVLDVAGTSATLQAQINPQGSETTYRFEYGTSEAYGSSIPVPDGLVGSGSAGVIVSAHPQDLSPSTTYHYRVIATVASRGETVPGSDGTFTTQSVGSELSLLDGRQWEMVSPPNKHGATITPILVGGVPQASEDGTEMTYATNAPTELEPKGFTDGAQVFSRRGADGWTSQDIATPHSAATGPSIGQGDEYRFFSSDLSLALVEPQGPFTPLSSEATERTAYLRHTTTCEATPATCYTPLVTAANVPPGTKFDGNPEYLTGATEFVGATPDLSHVVIGSEVPLTPTSDGPYEWAGGELQPVGVLPDGKASFGDLGDGNGENRRHAISNNGSRIIWSGVTEQQETHLYLRDMEKGETVLLDAVQPGASGAGRVEPVFQTANSDGSAVFFTDGQLLTKESGGSGFGEPDLYECQMIEVAGKLTCDLTDMTVNHLNPSELADVQGMVIGASEDGSYVYFVTNGALASGASPGDCSEVFPEVSQTCNLYVMHYTGSEWTPPTFIAALSGEDQPDWGEASGTLKRLTSRVSPNGRYLAFMSKRPLTNYDNHDANSGAPDEEVYLYDASSDRLVCASCNPTGARPVGTTYGQFGSIDGLLGGGDGVWPETAWLAANIPGWTPYRLEDALYQSRYLSDDGRLFFNSNDALVPQDVNGAWDVYEYEPEGTGSCQATSVAFSEKSDGCVGLISSGSSPEQSAFMDASKSGDDVFFLTTGKLAPQDFDTSYDIYDAHVCSASEPCLSSSVSPPPCNTGDSCKAAPSPQPSIFGSPSSSTFAGAGNAIVSPSNAVATPKSLTRAQKLAGALRACRKKPKKKRAACEKQARKRYGAKQSRKTNATQKSER